MTDSQTALSITLDIGAHMLSRGAEVGRVEDTMTRILKACGALRIDVFTITGSIVATIHWPDGIETQSRRIERISYNMNALVALNGLSRDICAGRCPLEQAPDRITAITSGRQYGFGIMLLLYALAAFAFCLFFGGSLLDGAVSAGIGILLWVLMAVFQRLRVPGIPSTLLLSIVGGLLAHGLSRMGLPCVADRVVLGDIMLLVPGIALTNSIRDMFTGDTISGLLRFFESSLLSLAMAWGFAVPSLM